MILELLSELQTFIVSLVPESTLVTQDAEEIRPALDNEQSVIWILPPERMAFPTGSKALMTLKPICFSPSFDSINEGINELEKLTAPIVENLNVSELTFDTLMLGNSDPYPAAELTFEYLTER